MTAPDISHYGSQGPGQTARQRCENAWHHPTLVELFWQPRWWRLVKGEFLRQVRTRHGPQRMRDRELRWERNPNGHSCPLRFQSEAYHLDCPVLGRAVGVLSSLAVWKDEQSPFRLVAHPNLAGSIRVSQLPSNSAGVRATMVWPARRAILIGAVMRTSNTRSSAGCQVGRKAAHDLRGCANSGRGLWGCQVVSAKLGIVRSLVLVCCGADESRGVQAQRHGHYVSRSQDSQTYYIVAATPKIGRSHYGSVARDSASYRCADLRSGQIYSSCARRMGTHQLALAARDTRLCSQDVDQICGDNLCRRFPPEQPYTDDLSSCHKRLHTGVPAHENTTLKAYATFENSRPGPIGSRHSATTCIQPRELLSHERTLGHLPSLSGDRARQYPRANRIWYVQRCRH
jgi:hypothetical protein